LFLNILTAWCILLFAVKTSAQSLDGDINKAEALKKLIGIKVSSGDQSAAKAALDDLMRLIHTSQDLQLVKQRATILTEAIGGFSEGIENPKEQVAWLEDNLQHVLQDTNNSPEDKIVFTMGLGDAYSDEGTKDKAKAAEALFIQAKQGTTNLEQKLECLHMISYCCYKLADYPGAIAAIEEMMPMVSSLPEESKVSSSQTLAQTIWSVENAFRQEQQWAKLVEIRGTVLDQYGKYFPLGEVFYFSVQNGRDAKTAGKTKDAIGWYDRAIKMYPSSGWNDSDFEALKGVGWNDSAIVNLNYEEINVLDSTNHSGRIKMLEAVWAKYGTNKWCLTYNLGANLANEYSAVKDNRGKQFLSDLLERMDFFQPKADSSDAKLLDELEEGCLIKLALWYGQDKEKDQMQATLKKYLAKYPNGNNAMTAKTLLASATGGIVPPKEESKARRAIVLVVLTLLTLVPLIVIMTRKMSHSNKSVSQPTR